MNSREQIEAAAERWKLHRTRVDDARSPYYSGTFQQDNHRSVLLDSDMHTLADACTDERDQRAKRIEALANDIDDILGRLSGVTNVPERVGFITELITRRMDGEST